MVSLSLGCVCLFVIFQSQHVELNRSRNKYKSSQGHASVKPALAPPGCFAACCKRRWYASGVMVPASTKALRRSRFTWLLPPLASAVASLDCLRGLSPCWLPAWLAVRLPAWLLGIPRYKIKINTNEKQTLERCRESKDPSETNYNYIWTN